MSFFMYRKTEQFAPEVEKIVAAHGTLPKVGLAAAKYTINMPEGYGSELVGKLSQLKDPTITYLLHVRSLKNRKVTQLDRELFKSVLETSLNEDAGEKMGLTDVVGHIDTINDEFDDYSEVISQFLDTMREYLSAKNLALAIDASDTDISYGFYTVTVTAILHPSAESNSISCSTSSSCNSAPS
jgi:hypothetical protein